MAFEGGGSGEGRLRTYRRRFATAGGRTRGRGFRMRGLRDAVRKPTRLGKLHERTL